MAKVVWIVCSNSSVTLELDVRLRSLGFITVFVRSEFDLSRQLSINPRKPELVVIHHALLWTIKPIHERNGKVVMEGSEQFQSLEYHGSLAFSHVRACKSVTSRLKTPVVVITNEVAEANAELARNQLVTFSSSSIQ